MTIVLKKGHFSGSANVFGSGGLEAVIRGLAIDAARRRATDAGITDFTDNSTGTAAATLPDLTLPTEAFESSSSDAAQTTALNTALGKIENASAVVASQLNLLRGKIGLPLITWSVGTIAAAGTIPALDLTVTGANGATAAAYSSGRSALDVAKGNIRRLVSAFNGTMAALGYTALPSNLSGSYSSNLALVDIPTVTADDQTDNTLDGKTSLRKTTTDTFLTAVGAIFATMASHWNAVMQQVTELSDLTDSTGGTAAAGLVANPLPAAADGAATTSSPKAGFDSEIAKFANATASLAARINVFRALNDLPLITYASGTVSTTLASESVNLTAVDGSSGTSAVDQASGRDRLTKTSNALSTLMDALNEVRQIYGLPVMPDALDGDVSDPPAIPALAATATGVSGAGATLLDADVDAWLVINRNNIATLAAGVNALTGTGQSLLPPLSVVAG